MSDMNWADSISAAITVCDLNGIIIYLNHQSAEVFAKYGGSELIGKSLFDCHSSDSVQKIQEMLITGSSNHYTIQKNGIKKMVSQTPFFEGGKVAGMVEISYEIPEWMPHFNRDQK